MKKREITRVLIPTLKLNDYVGNTNNKVSNESLIDCVVLAPNDYLQLFGRNRSQAKGIDKVLAVVKIKSTKTKKVIWRRFFGEPAMKHKEYAAVTYSSLYELADIDYKELIEGDVVLCKGNWFMYYWNHPFHATRISAKLGFISVVLAAISIVISICL